MPANLPLLYELEITISSPVDNGFPVRCVLKEHGPYPPEPKREGNEITFPSRFTVYEADGWSLPSEVVRAAMRSADLSKLGLHFDLAKRMRAHMDDLADAIFRSPVVEFLDRLLSQAERFTPYGPPPKALSRITIVFDGLTPDDQTRALEQMPWELLNWRGQELRQRCVIMRRSLDKSGEKSGSFDLPLNVALMSETPMVSHDHMGEWGNNLFDHFTAEARALGGIEWGNVGYSAIKLGEVLHVVFDSFDAESLLRLEQGIQSLGEGLPDSDGWAVPPRLLVLHDVSGDLPTCRHATHVNAALARGADAVLLVALPSTDPKAGNFFPTFYRKLMHNWPLDQCAWAAQAEAISNQTPVDLIFGARQGGEFALLLTRAVLEATQVKPVPKTVRRSRGRPQLEIVLDENAPRMAEDRSSRVAIEIEDILRRAAETMKNRAFDSVADSTREIRFDQELHGVSEVVNARRNAREVMREAAPEIEETEEMAKGIAASAPAAVQEAMVRLTNLWITEDNSPDEPWVITAYDYLVSQQPYDLHLQIGPRHEGALVAERFNEESLTKVFEKVDEVMLDVMFFTTNQDFKLAGDELEEAPEVAAGYAVHLEKVDGEETKLRSERARWGRRAKLRLPRFGPSSELKIEITPQDAGLRRIRTCIYYRNVLLQSVLLEAQVAEQGTKRAANELVSKDTPTITGRTTDYIATVDFALLDELPEPSLNLFSNHDANGTHWVGAYSADDTSAFELHSGDMRVFDKELLNTRAEVMRKIFIEIEGEKNAYKLDAPLPLDEKNIERREGYLRDLALSGWRLFHPLFVVSSDGDAGGDNAKRLEKFRNTTKDSHIISIARCGPESSTLPWAALYSNYLDRNKEDQIRLCEVFKLQLAQNKWDDENTLVEKHDLLDEPKKCRSLPDCPLSTDKRKVTVCPFGFWGFIHQVEQPLQQVKPTPVDTEPKEFENHNFSQTSFLTRATGDPVKVAVGTNPGIPDVSDHQKEIARLPLDMAYRDDRDKIMLLLTEGGQHVYYFYCHGDVDQENVFRLILGTAANPGYIESSDLLPDEINWQTPKPLFIMNGCETMAVTPDMTHGFLNTLKALGASGVVGTEVKVWTQLARPFGLQLLKHLLNGKSIGEAFLEVRKNLLRQYNPLGLIYSYYSPATLHLHDPADCDWCKTHKAKNA